MVGVSLMLAIPALMIGLSVLLPGQISRWLNVAVGVAYTAIELLTLSSPHLFYKIIVLLEIAATLGIVVMAWRGLKETGR